jgi:hypothetical protein
MGARPSKRASRKPTGRDGVNASAGERLGAGWHERPRIYSLGNRADLVG